MPSAIKPLDGMDTFSQANLQYTRVCEIWAYPKPDTTLLWAPPDSCRWHLHLGPNRGGAQYVVLAIRVMGSIF